MKSFGEIDALTVISVEKQSDIEVKLFVSKASDSVSRSIPKVRRL